MRATAKSQLDAGNFRDAYDHFRKLCLDPNTDAARVGQDFHDAVNCLNQLGRVNEFDALAEHSFKIHGNHWRFVQAAANEYLNIDHNGFLIAGKFERGGHRGGGMQVNSLERDRVLAIQQMLRVLPLVIKDDNKEDVAQFFQTLANHLLANRGYYDAWRLLHLTDLSKLPDYDDGFGFGREYRGAPVDEAGNPIFHQTVKTWEVAKTDGERWRWALDQISENQPTKLKDVKRELATFSQQQFDVTTLSILGGHGNLFVHPTEELERKEDKKDESGLYAVHTLNDNETIAKLANGVKRFNLPDDYNFLKIYKELGDHEQLGSAYENRRQYPKAAEQWKILINLRAGAEALRTAKALQEPLRHDEPHEIQRYKQIVGNWGSFLPTEDHPAGEGAKLEFRFRNGKKVHFEAFSIDEAKVIDEIKAYLKSDPQRFDASLANLYNIGWRFLDKKFLGPKVADWKLDLDPRENHWDRHITINTPLQKAGGYFVTAKMEGGNVSRLAVFVTDTVIVKKELSDERPLYFVADAITGHGIAGANVEFFGYKEEQIAAGRSRIVTKNFAERTDANGLVIPDKRDLDGDFQWLIVARTPAGRLAHFGFENIGYGGTYDQEYNATKIFHITDRPVYRPQQKLHFKFWVRQAKYDQENQPQFVRASMPVEIYNPKGEKVFSQTFTTDEYGGVEGEWNIPHDATLGVYQLNANALQHGDVITSGGGSFRVEEYKKPEYAVSIDAPHEPVMLGEKIIATIKAKYYFGSPVTKATVKYKITRVDKTDQWLPRAPWDWCYGPGYWWFAYDYHWYPKFSNWVGCRRPQPFWWPDLSQGPPEVISEREVPVGPDGTVKVEIDTQVAKDLHGHTDHQYTITAEVRDESRRTIVGVGHVLVARKPFKVYAWLDRGYYKVGDAVNSHFLAQTLNHKPVAGKGELTLLQITYDANRKPQETPVQSWKLDTDSNGNAKQQLKASSAGQYRLSYQLTDSQGHSIEGGYIFTVIGQGFDGREFRFNPLELIPDKREYEPGDTVRLQINSDRPDGTVLLFLRPSNGIYLPPQIIRMKGKSTVAEIAVVKQDMPNFFVEALTVNGAQVHTETKEIVVPPTKRILNVEVLPSEKEYLPGQDAKVKIRVTDYTGESYAGSLVVSMYDKAVEYIFGGSNVPDIKEFFWKWRRDHYPNGDTNLSRYSEVVIQGNEVDMAAIGAFGETLSLDSAGKGGPGFMDGGGGFGGGMGGGGGFAFEGMAPRGGARMMAMATGGAALAADDLEVHFSLMAPGKNSAVPLAEATVRSNFADTAFWNGTLRTDKNGIAEVSLKMPENLTAWKIKVWGMGQGTRVGSGESEVVTRKNLIVRLQAPRFFVQKDEVVLSANVHNYLKTDKQVTVTLETAYDSVRGNSANAPGSQDSTTKRVSPLEPQTPLVQKITVAAGGEQRVDWRMKVLDEGTAIVRMKAQTDEESDAMDVKLPSYVHGMLKTEAWAGTVRGDQERSQLTFNVPVERRADQALLEIRYTPTLAGAMIDALPYMADYPYGCTEQTLNRFLPSVVTQKVLRELGVNLADVQKKRTNLNAQEIGNDVERAKQWKRQNRSPVFDETELNRMVKEGLTALTNMQCSDGGWGWFSGANERSSPHTTAVVVHGMQIAQQNDLALVPGVLERGIEWLKQYQNATVQELKNAPFQKKPWKSFADNLDALVYMILVDAGVDHQEMRDFLYRDRVHLAVYGKAMFGLALQQQNDADKLAIILQNIDQFVVQDAENETAYLKLPESNLWWYWYGSEVEANAYYLKLLSQVLKKGEPAAKKTAGVTASRLIKYLLNNRKHGTYWNSTRDTALCVEAFADYLRASGEQKPDLFVEVWLDGKKEKESRVTADNLFSFDNKFVLSGEAVQSGSHTLELRRRGTGPVYFNTYLTNFTLEDRITRAGLEIKVERKFYQLILANQTTNVRGSRGQSVDQIVEKYERRPLTDLSTLKSGDLVEVELEIDSKNDYEYLLFEDSKAAGFETVDVRSGYTANGLGAYMEVRDNRVSFFVQSLSRGKHSLAYRLRAEIPGKFSALPAKASAMYAPELKANSDEARLTVVD